MDSRSTSDAERAAHADSESQDFDRYNNFSSPCPSLPKHHTDAAPEIPRQEEAAALSAASTPRHQPPNAIVSTPSSTSAAPFFFNNTSHLPLSNRGDRSPSSSACSSSHCRYSSSTCMSPFVYVDYPSNPNTPRLPTSHAATPHAASPRTASSHATPRTATPHTTSSLTTTPRSTVTPRKKQKAVNGHGSAAPYSQPASGRQSPTHCALTPAAASHSSHPSICQDASCRSDFAIDVEGQHEMAAPSTFISSSPAVAPYPFAPPNVLDDASHTSAAASAASSRHLLPKKAKVKNDCVDEFKADDGDERAFPSSSSGNRKPWTCEICKRIFTSDRARHLNTHENTDLHFCWICFKSSRQSYNLTDHQCVFGSRTVRCNQPLCLFRGASAGELTSHRCSQNSHLVLMPDTGARFTAAQVQADPERFTYTPNSQSSSANAGPNPSHPIDDQKAEESANNEEPLLSRHARKRTTSVISNADQDVLRDDVAANNDEDHVEETEHEETAPNLNEDDRQRSRQQFYLQNSPLEIELQHENSGSLGCIESPGVIVNGDIASPLGGESFLFLSPSPPLVVLDNEGNMLDEHHFGPPPAEPQFVPSDDGSVTHAQQ